MQKQNALFGAVSKPMMKMIIVFTKTGSGHTWQNLRKEREREAFLVFSAEPANPNAYGYLGGLLNNAKRWQVRC